MQNSGLKAVKQILDGGFYHKNLERMGDFCRQERDPRRLIGSYVLCGIFYEFASIVEANPSKETIEGLESKYKPLLDAYLESVISGSPAEDQFMILTELIQLHWKIQE